MSWIFHEPLEPAIYARRRVAPMASTFATFNAAARFAALDLFSEEPWPTQRRAYAPLVARRGFGRPRAVYALDVFADDPWTRQRRAYAPLHVIAATISPFSPAGRVLASLLAAGVFDETAVAYHRPPFVLGHVTPGPDGGQSASFTVSATGLAPAASVNFTGQGDDPYGNDGLLANATQGLGALALEVLAVEELATFSGASASRVV